MKQPDLRVELMKLLNCMKQTADQQNYDRHTLGNRAFIEGWKDGTKYWIVAIKDLLQEKPLDLRRNRQGELD